MFGSPTADPPPREARRPSVAGHRVIGAKHVREGRPCQDAIRIAEANGTCLAAAIADGHGSSIHAEAGSQLAVELTTEALLAFASGLTAEQRADARAVHTFAQDPLRRQLVREWIARVRVEAGSESVELKDFGTTLLFVLLLPELVLVGQLGDGDILIVDHKGAVSRPLPSDPTIGEETLSLCLPDAATSMRVLAIPNPRHESLLLLSTDGYSKSYPNDEEFEQIGPDYLQLVRELGISGVEESLHDFLTAVTKAGSGDDIAFLVVHLPGVPAEEGEAAADVAAPPNAPEPAVALPTDPIIPSTPDSGDST